MIRTKYLGIIIAIVSTSFLFSGSVQQLDRFSNDNGCYNNASRVNVSLVSYDYPYYYDKPYYFLDGLYYYGGNYRNGFYHYGDRHFKYGHYYADGNRYYNGRRYNARNGVNGYYKSRWHYERSRNYSPKRMRTNRSKVYGQKQGHFRNKTNHVGTRKHTARSHNTPRRSKMGSIREVQRTIRSRSRPLR